MASGECLQQQQHRLEEPHLVDNLPNRATGGREGLVIVRAVSRVFSRTRLHFDLADDGKTFLLADRAIPCLRYSNSCRNPPISILARRNSSTATFALASHCS
jgi:hypothetical protein